MAEPWLAKVWTTLASVTYFDSSPYFFQLSFIFNFISWIFWFRGSWLKSLNTNHVCTYSIIVISSLVVFSVESFHLHYLASHQTFLSLFLYLVHWVAHLHIFFWYIRLVFLFFFIFWSFLGVLQFFNTNMEHSIYYT